MQGIEQEIKCVTSAEEILKELENSRDNGNAIGITALSWGPTMIMTAVEEIIDIKNDKIIALKEQDLLGMSLPDSEILLSEIVKVNPLRTLYNDPFHVQLRDVKR